MSWVVNPGLNLQKDIVSVLKSIGKQEKYVEAVASILVGLEKADPHLLPKYVEFFNSLEPKDRDALR